MVKIGIDPGHGGRDPGAVAADGLTEKEVNLAVGLKLYQLLEEAGINAVMTRTADEEVSLAERVALLNREKVDLVLSLHVNSCTNPQANYLASFILAPGGEAEKAARFIQRELVQATGWPDGGVRQANFYILRETEAPAVLVEMGFLSNPQVAAQLAQNSFQEKLARAIFRGVLFYLGFDPDEPLDIQGHWAEEAIRLVRKAGIMSGYPDGTFKPDQPATRAELAVALANLIIKFNLHP